MSCHVAFSKVAKQSPTEKPFYIASVLGCLLPLLELLSGCAGQMAYREGKTLVAEGKPEAGLAKFQEAAAADPRDVRFRTTYLTERERIVNDWLSAAERAAAAGEYETAARLYRQVLSTDSTNARALTRLDALEADKRHAKLRDEAKGALGRNDLDTAKLRLAAVLAERPADGDARRLQQAIAEKGPRPSAENRLSNAYRKPISIEFKDVALKHVFDVISRTSGLNFLFDRDVRTDQRTSIFLRDSTTEAAIDFVLLTNQLEQQILDGNTVLIYPNQPTKQKDYQPMVVRSFYLANAEAKNLANSIKSIVKTRDMVVDDKLNLLIVRDSPDAIKLIEKLVALQDVPEPEVMLEVEILEINRTRLQQLGVQWPATLGLTPLPLGAVRADGVTGPLTLRDLRQQNSGTLAATVGPITLNANVQDGDVNILANPRIRARNHENAKIYIGERVPNVTTTANSTGFIAETINYVDVGLKLDVQPTVYLEDDVAIKISLEVSSIIDQVKTAAGTTAYRIGTRNATTVLRLKDGETQILAGLINNEDRHSGNRLPGVGELPVVGRLFGNGTDNTQKSEIVLSITPRLIRNILRPTLNEMQFPSGTESSLRNRPDYGGTTPAGPPNPTTTHQVTANVNDSVASGVGLPSSGIKMRWLGPVEARVGEPIAVALHVQPDRPIADVPLVIAYDNKALEAVNVTEGGFLKQGGAATAFKADIQSGSGQIVLNASRVGSGATIPGVVATIAFRTLAAGENVMVQVASGAPLGEGKAKLAAMPTTPYRLNVQP